MKTSSPLPDALVALSTDDITVTGEVKGNRTYVRLRHPGYAADPVDSCRRQRVVMDRVIAALAATHKRGRDGFRGNETRSFYCLFDLKETQ